MERFITVIVAAILLSPPAIVGFRHSFTSLYRPQISLTSPIRRLDVDDDQCHQKNDPSSTRVSRWGNPPYIAVLTEPDACTSIARVEETIQAIELATSDGGVNLVVLRVAVADDPVRVRECALRKWALLRRLAEMKSRRKFILVVNDDVDLVLKALSQNVTVDGVHVKERNAHLIPSIRTQLEHHEVTCSFQGIKSFTNIVIGTSCHTIQSATTSYQLSPRGPDYLFVGTCYFTQSHPEKQTLDQLEGPQFPGKVKQELYQIHDKNKRRIPPPVIFAIGGINEENCREPVVTFGADGVAVIRTVMQAPDPREMVQRMKSAINNEHVGIREESIQHDGNWTYVSHLSLNNNQPMNYSIFQGYSAVRLLPDVWKSRFQASKRRYGTNKTRKTIWALELIGQGYLDAAHEVIMGVTKWDDLDKAEHVAIYEGQKNWSQKNYISDIDDVIHSIIHRLEGNAIGEGGYTGYQNAKYLITGGPKQSRSVLPSIADGNEVALVYEVLTEYLKQMYPELVESLITSSDELHYEIIVEGGRCRNVTVPPYSWNGLALIDLWTDTFTATSASTVAKDDMTWLRQRKLQELFRAELHLWWRCLTMTSLTQSSHHSTMAASATTATTTTLSSAAVKNDSKIMKKELLQWLFITYPIKDIDSRSKSLVDTNGWSVLDPSKVSVQDTSMTGETSHRQSKSMQIDIELPLLNGLLFVNKPSGYSTLPTKQQLDNPAGTVFPCLSDKVKEWLRSDPKGRQRMKEAIQSEERWWDLMISTMFPKKRHMLKRWKKDQEKAKLTTFEARPVHRLDIHTSGIICIALTPYALRAANMLFEGKSRQAASKADAFETERELVHKSYIALVEGRVGCEEEGSIAGVIDHAIGKVWAGDHNEWACDVSHNGTMAFIRSGNSSAFSFVPGSLREAVTSYRTVDITSDKDGLCATRVELIAHTGRGHQLRLHMASIGHPIVGDVMHGFPSEPAEILSECRLCLHASKLSMDAWYMNEEGTFQIGRVTVESGSPF